MADWKEKYFASLENLEEKEKGWHETDQLLRRCLSRITLSADGQDKKLDDLLERLRNSVRNEKNLSRIQNTVDAIIETAAEIADSKPKKITVPQVLLEILKKIEFPKKFANDVKRVRKKIEYANENRDPAELIDSLVSLLSEIIEEAEDSAGVEKEKKGLFSGLFGKGDKAPIEEKQPDVGVAKSEEVNSEVNSEVKQAKQADIKPGTSDVDEALVLVRDVLTDYLRQIQVLEPDAASMGKVRLRVQSISARGELKQLVADMAKIIKPANPEHGQEDSAGNSEEKHGFEINEILIQLLERMGLPVELNERVEALKLKWQDGVSEDQIVDALEDIAELVIEIRTRIEREKNEIQLFLQQVTDRLLELDKHIQEDTALSAGIFEENKSFGEAVDGQVKNIRSDVQDATDLAKLKLSIYEKLEIINGHVEGFRGKEEQRKEAMQARVEALTKKVSELEGESSQLREKIVEEKQQSMLDALTRIPNRLAWNERITLEYNRWRRYKSPLVIAVWDVDDFKKINDTYGHKAGDKVLMTISNVFKDQVRETDFLARFGGEEFVVLLTETSLNDSVAVMEKLRKAIEGCQFHHGEKAVKITVSGGFTEFKGDDTEESAFERADQFMYQAKRSGKNRCISDNDN
ncbi:sensor domain-containing diguanylate cyclase [Sulfuriflexus mobilis]|uniref:sensor domain-containing diguanylate cyclase n=1 Tax=Sulfuriflexus mobilis TaxID=1811807 RepID=UPI000F81B5B9|nr:GGDEF domain-containing protein [Sulfuriflexus mobilis]